MIKTGDPPRVKGLRHAEIQEGTIGRETRTIEQKRQYSLQRKTEAKTQRGQCGRVHERIKRGNLHSKLRRGKKGRSRQLNGPCRHRGKEGRKPKLFGGGKTLERGVKKILKKKRCLIL